jgi:hypothetical protein
MAESSWDHPDPARLVAFGRGILDREEVNDRRLKVTAWRRANPTQAFD